MKWLRFIRKLKPYNIQKGLRYLKHYGPKEFLIRLSERMEPEEVPYGPWREQYCAKEEDLARQKNHKFSYCPKISVVVPAYRTPEIFLRQMIESRLKILRNYVFLPCSLYVIIIKVCLIHFREIRCPDSLMQLYPLDQKE